MNLADVFGHFEAAKAKVGDETVSVKGHTGPSCFVPHGVRLSWDSLRSPGDSPVTDKPDPPVFWDGMAFLVLSSPSIR